MRAKGCPRCLAMWGGAADAFEQPGQPVAHSAAAAVLSGGDADQVLNGVHVHGRGAEPGQREAGDRVIGSDESGHDKPIVGKLTELVVAVIDREDRGADAAGVGDPLEKTLRSGLWCDDEQRLASPHRPQPVQTHAQVWRRVAGWRPPHQGRGELQPTGETRLVVEVCRQMPRLLLGGPHQKEAAASEARLVQRTREAPAALDPARRREQLAQHLHPRGVHLAIVPGSAAG